ncbi:AAA family ATPase [Streptomyces sp. NPDC102406]|uniref:AAA family ATPase n=1 Tax=Streptomyces sp. NPDC102406 TaxID=3366171 RepID=UPI003817382A
MSKQRGPVVAVAAEPDGLPWPQGPLENGPRGLLVGLVVPDGDPRFDEALEQQLAALELWWPRGGGEFDWRLSENPDGTPLSTRHEVEMYLAHSGLRDADAATPLVLFVSGHGLAARSTRHYLRLPDTTDERLLATAVPTSALACAALDSHAQDVLVILNMCESAAVQSELLALQDDLAPARKEDARLNVLATTERGRPVLGYELARVLSRAYLLATTSEQIAHPHLTMSEFTHLLNRAAKLLEDERPVRRGPRRARARVNIPQPLLTQWQHERSPALPNPGYEPAPRVAKAEVSDVAATFDELEYWLEKASGRLDKADGGWYFSGRTRLNRLLVEFIQRPRGTVIVTGSAGTGKSALLGRMVTLSDPVFRGEERYKTALDGPPETIPPAGAVTAAVSARNHTALSALRRLCEALGCRPAADTDELGDWQTALEKFLNRPGPPVTVVVDSLDEAYDPTHFITTALAPFVTATRTQRRTAGGVPAPAGRRPAARRRGVRLILGVRSARPTTHHGAPRPAADDLLAELTDRFPHARTLRCDTDPAADIDAYVRVLLRDQEQWDAATVSRAAHLVGTRAAGSFLHARLAVEQLRAAGPKLLADRDWLHRVGEGITGLLRTDIELAVAAGSGLTAAEAVGLLRASAFALGRGVAWGDVWPALTHAVLRAPLRDPDEKIRRLLKSRLAGYLTTDHEDDRVVYRPAHEQLAQILRRWPTP